MTQDQKEENAKQWLNQVKDFIKSEMDRHTYCQKHNIDPNRLIYWIGRHYELSKGLIPAHVSIQQQEIVKQEPKSMCDIELTSGDVIKINNPEIITQNFNQLIQTLVCTRGSQDVATN